MKKVKRMILSKDECYILSACLPIAFDRLTNKMYDASMVKKIAIALKDLEDRLDDVGFDERRQGRTTCNDLLDVLKRYSNKINKKKTL